MSPMEPSAATSHPHITVARHGAAERHRHLSAVLEQIRDDGPALNIGPVPFPADNLRPTESPAVAAAANDAKASAPAPHVTPVPDTVTATPAIRSPRYPWAVCLLLAVMLVSSIGYSAWLHMRIGALEVQMLSLADGQEQK